ncbi:hypothetical protein GCM10007897_07650 [Sphingobium jiangsuense]|uniref:Antibiotic biosynthesis monooxygenase (ABM) superfamily enzyme n=1 Tax=Sphingobium jiangsuense TaxID=870476 RepID=A0A7W6BT32_9SPHN|nr:hypothetical protein [Sphingobium jiangsuense]MBB3928238.1 antibiotic biosynthesis monooxygenase (ABM) superfamily enzyme [Sphingobium jiangsuense]GLS99386.1 hypothetical protein GCM10007897_07650 [Sphingobium jiangsuense]
MYIRAAYWLGRPKQGQEESFREIISGELVPTMRGFPGVSGVKILWPEQHEDGAPPVYCQVLVEFADEAGRTAMMTSPERTALRPRVLDAAGLFDGVLAHIDFEVK